VADWMPAIHCVGTPVSLYIVTFSPSYFPRAWKSCACVLQASICEFTGITSTDLPCNTDAFTCGPGRENAGAVSAWARVARSDASVEAETAVPPPVDGDVDVPPLEHEARARAPAVASTVIMNPRRFLGALIPHGAVPRIISILMVTLTFGVFSAHFASLVPCKTRWANDASSRCRAQVVMSG
jgi:hypothetical protein